MTFDALDFYDGAPSTIFAPGRIVRVPAGIKDKPALLALLSDALSFPEHFGNNWDAFRECINDLDWLRDTQVTLVHEDVPLEPNERDARMYLDLLCEAIVEIERKVPLSAWFAESSRPQIQWLAR